MPLIAQKIIGGVVASGSPLDYTAPTDQVMRVMGFVIRNDNGATSSTFAVGLKSGGGTLTDADRFYLDMDIDTGNPFREWAANELGLMSLYPSDKLEISCPTGQIVAAVFGEAAQ